jgi:uncharacterized protein
MSFATKTIVIDTSVLIAACIYPDRKPAAIFRQALVQFKLAVSAETLGELEVVLGRSKFDRWRAAEERLAWFEQYRDNVTLYDTPVISTACDDPKDNKFLDIALAAKAIVIVASDDDLWRLHPHKGIDILSLQDFQSKYLM